MPEHNLSINLSIKTGSVSDPSNYRGLAIGPALAKLFSRHVEASNQRLSSRTKSCYLITKIGIYEG